MTKIMKKLIDNINRTRPCRSRKQLQDSIVSFLALHGKTIREIARNTTTAYGPIISRIGTEYAIAVTSENPYEAFAQFCLGIALIIAGDKYIKKFENLERDKFFEKYISVKDDYDALLSACYP